MVIISHFINLIQNKYGIGRLYFFQVLCTFWPLRTRFGWASLLRLLVDWVFWPVGPGLIRCLSKSLVKRGKSWNMPRTTQRNASRSGEYKFETKNETNSQISVGNTLRKTRSIFHRLPTGHYGLIASGILMLRPRAKHHVQAKEKRRRKEPRQALNST